MLRIQKILEIKDYTIKCLFNNGMVGNLELESLLLSQSHIPGVSSILNLDKFKEVEIGEFGELTWRKLVNYSDNGEKWDYDISPEFAYQNSEILELLKK